MKNSLKYILLILLVIMMVLSITLSTLYIKYDSKGEFNLIKQYSDIHFNNINLTNGVSVKLNEESSSIRVNISPLEKEAEFTVDIVNTGNKDVILKNFSYTNIVTNLDQDNIIIDSSLREGSVIRGGEIKKLKIVVNNSGKTVSDSEYNFNINYVFE